MLQGQEAPGDPARGVGSVHCHGARYFPSTGLAWTSSIPGQSGTRKWDQSWRRSKHAGKGLHPLENAGIQRACVQVSSRPPGNRSLPGPGATREPRGSHARATRGPRGMLPGREGSGGNSPAAAAVSELPPPRLLANAAAGGGLGTLAIHSLSLLLSFFTERDSGPSAGWAAAVKWGIDGARPLAGRPREPARETTHRC